MISTISALNPSKSMSSGKTVTVIGVSSHDEGNAALLRAGAVTSCAKRHIGRIQEIIDKTAAQANNDINGTGLRWSAIPGSGGDQTHVKNGVDTQLYGSYHTLKH